ncbi:hypothetical protein JTB14_031900 [Gonioctena quinquepunctata]|nr:hypothetical protein JTB14_031900 [Gonioctena quinquepunctata]
MKKNWIRVLPDIEDDFNVTVNKSSGYAPWVLMFGESRRLRSANQLLAKIPSPNEVIDAKIQSEVNKRLEILTEKTKRIFNKKRVKAVPYVVGDKVAIENSQMAYGGELKPKFQSPFEEVHCLLNERYVLRKVGSRGRTNVAAHEQLRTWPTQ